VKFIDLVAQQARLRDKIDARIAAVLNHGIYIMGPEVRILEIELAAFCGASHAISCANGTDALQLACMALNLGPGDAVLVPSFNFAAAAEAPCLVGATPVFVDSDPLTYNMDPDSLVRALDQANYVGLTPKAIVAVDLFGLPANYPVIGEIAKTEDLHLIGDSAQGWGGTIEGQMTGTFGTLTTTSFFPAKPLGCYGDGGALFTQDAKIAKTLDSLRVHGKGSHKYDNVRIGMNSRLDTLQAAILLEKLAIYIEEIEARNQVAARYTAALKNQIQTPTVPDGYRSIWSQYTLRAHSSQDREDTMAALKMSDIPSVIYPTPLHMQSAYRHFPRDPKGLPQSERMADEVFSLPMHPYLSSEDQGRVIEVLQKKPTDF
jgi:dTDP-4-amino-4,6-dideoxygalactose transaminase